MPYRDLGEFKAKIQFVCPARFPSLITKAALKTDVPSQTRYIQLAVCHKLAEDLGIDEGELIRSLPPTRGPATLLFGDRQTRRRTAPRPGR
jgi:hypothetical protein